MRAILIAATAMLVGLMAGTTAPADGQTLTEMAAAKAKSGSFVDLTPAMVAFIDTTADLADADRVVRFHAVFDPVLPGYFNDKGDDQAKIDASIAKTLREFPAQKAKFLATAAAFRRAFDLGQAHFRNAFPDYRLTLPVYLVHSMGQQDGGTRTVGGQSILFFGADVIARIHDETTIGPFLDHEILHAYHSQFFPDCDQLWCSVWQEGLATYVSSRLNPGLDDRQMMLTMPRPIRPEVEPRLKEAMCGLVAKFKSTSQDDYAPLFYGRPSKGPFPPRYGYFLGYLLVQAIGETMPLDDLVKLPPAKVEPLLLAGIARYGPCPADVTP